MPKKKLLRIMQNFERVKKIIKEIACDNELIDIILLS